MVLVAWLLFTLLCTAIGLTTAMVVFHLNRYSVPGDRTAFIRRVFLAGNAFFFVLALIAFLSSPFGGLR